ncbi:hypothetical protein ScPMuIL_006239 [Solemya velum]
MHTWNSIGHMTNPFLYGEVQSEWTDKEIYLRCSPEVNKALHQQNAILTVYQVCCDTYFQKKYPRLPCLDLA